MVGEGELMVSLAWNVLLKLSGLFSITDGRLAAFGNREQFRIRWKLPGIKELWGGPGVFFPLYVVCFTLMVMFEE